MVTVSLKGCIRNNASKLHIVTSMMFLLQRLIAQSNSTSKHHQYFVNISQLLFFLLDLVFRIYVQEKVIEQTLFFCLFNQKKLHDRKVKEVGIYE